MSRRRLLFIAAPLALIAILVVVSFLDARAHDGTPLRGVTVAGHDVGGLDDDDLADELAAVAQEYGKAEIVISTPDGDIETTGAAVGLAVDIDATAELAVDEGRADLLPLRPLRWLQSLVTSREAGIVAEVDRATLRDLVAAEDPSGRTETLEPGVTGADGELAVVEGSDGKGLDAAEIADAIEAAAASGELPITVHAEPGTVSPRYTRADAEALLAEAEALTDGPLAVTAGDLQTDIPASTLRRWLRSRPGDESLELTLDEGAVLAGLEELLAPAEVTPVSARFDVQGGRPVIVRGVEGKQCCEPTVVAMILDALRDNDEPLAVPMKTVQPEDTSAELEALGIVEEVGSFTTRHNCCESRVTNIHRIADIVRGQIIPPGGRFSVNGFVGERTTANGFVEGGVIQNGVFETSVGGGISQFATTTFNAAFFAGLDLVEYQSHSIYISRYPYGREATLSFPKPDLVIGNPSPHGVLIWPTYTGTTITVTLYSTRWAHGEQTAQTEQPVGQAGCKRVTTTRTVTYEDGREPEQDKVFATYRPAEGVQCDGPPPTTTTTTTAPPETTTTQPPADGG